MWDNKDGGSSYELPCKIKSISLTSLSKLYYKEKKIPVPFNFLDYLENEVN